MAGIWSVSWNMEWIGTVQIIRFFCSFEGLPNKDSGSKTVEIFPIIDQNSSEDSITICCSKEARVKDVIGLACLKYCAKERPRKLEPPVSSYELFMCEEDGTLDSDFPALDSNVGQG